MVEKIMFHIELPEFGDKLQFSDKQNDAWPPFQDAINEDAGQQFVNQQVPGSTFQYWTCHTCLNLRILFNGLVDGKTYRKP